MKTAQCAAAVFSQHSAHPKEVHTRQTVVIKKRNNASLIIMNYNKNNCVFQQLTDHFRQLWGRCFGGVHDIFEAVFTFQQWTFDIDLYLFVAWAQNNSIQLTNQISKIYVTWIKDCKCRCNGLITGHDSTTKVQDIEEKTTIAQFSKPGKLSATINTANVTEQDKGKHRLYILTQGDGQQVQTIIASKTKQVCTQKREVSVKHDRNTVSTK